MTGARRSLGVIGLLALTSIPLEVRSQDTAPPAATPDIDQLEKELGKAAAAKKKEQAAKKHAGTSQEQRSIREQAVEEYKQSQQALLHKLLIRNQCNTTVYVAFAFWPIEGTSMLSVGWYKLGYNGIALMPQNTYNTKAYFYAHSEDGTKEWAGNGGDSVTGQLPNQPFTISIPNEFPGFVAYRFRSISLVGGSVTEQQLTCN